MSETLLQEPPPAPEPAPEWDTLSLEDKMLAFHRWHTRGGGPPSRVQALELARLFPCLREKFDGKINQWDTRVLGKIARPWSTGEKHALSFVFQVWNCFQLPPGWKKFDLVDALSTLDRHHRKVIALWCSNPFWL